MPTRIQLSRRKGWRMPANTVKVDRTNKRFGNPFRVLNGNNRQAVDCFRSWINDFQTEGRYVIPLARRDLRGKNLACWCPLDCHADVLLEIANA